MKKKTVWIGVVIVALLTLLLAAGIFLMDRYNGLNNARAQMEDAQEAARASFLNKIDLAQQLVEATPTLKNAKAYDKMEAILTSGKSSLTKKPADLFRLEADFNKQVNDYVDTINEDATLKQKTEVTSVLGELSGNDESLNEAKTEYNALVQAYEKKRMAHPRFVADFLGFSGAQSFDTSESEDGV